MAAPVGGVSIASAEPDSHESLPRQTTRSVNELPVFYRIPIVVLNA